MITWLVTTCWLVSVWIFFWAETELGRSERSEVTRFLQDWRPWPSISFSRISSLHNYGVYGVMMSLVFLRRNTNLPDESLCILSKCTIQFNLLRKEQHHSGSLSSQSSENSSNFLEVKLPRFSSLWLGYIPERPSCNSHTEAEETLFC